MVTLEELALRVVARHLARDVSLEEVRFDVVDEIGRNEPDPDARAKMIEVATALLDDDAMTRMSREFHASLEGVTAAEALRQWAAKHGYEEVVSPPKPRGAT